MRIEAASIATRLLIRTTRMGDKMAEVHTWAVGDEATWVYTPRGGYGYTVPVKATVVSVGAARVQVSVEHVTRGTFCRWVSLDNLRPRSAALTSEGKHIPREGFGE